MFWRNNLTSNPYVVNLVSFHFKVNKPSRWHNISKWGSSANHEVASNYSPAHDKSLHFIQTFPIIYISIIQHLFHCIIKFFVHATHPEVTEMVPMKSAISRDLRWIFQDQLYYYQHLLNMKTYFTWTRNQNVLTLWKKVTYFQNRFIAN
jgi:hypothetical protein